MHLRVADPQADLALGEVVPEAELNDLPLHLGKRPPGAGDRVAVLHELVRGVLVAQELDERRRLVLVAQPSDAATSRGLGDRPSRFDSSSVSRLTASDRSWRSRGTCSDQPLSRKCRLSSPRIVGAA